MAPSILLKDIQKGSEDEALNIVKEGLSAISSLSTEYSTLFEYNKLSEAQNAFSTPTGDAPEKMTKAVASTCDVLDTIITKMSTLERYLYLTIPKMEDGNNFGVTVQLNGMKQLKDDTKDLQTSLDSIMTYYTSRADLVEKCKFASSVTSKSKSESSSSAKSTSTKEEENKDGKSEDSKSESKTIETQHTTAEQKLRAQALTVCDVSYYQKCKTAYAKATTCYMVAIDYMDKNKEKLSKPKGTGGGGYSSMY